MKHGAKLDAIVTDLVLQPMEEKLETAETEVGHQTEDITVASSTCEPQLSVHAKFLLTDRLNAIFVVMRGSNFKSVIPDHDKLEHQHFPPLRLGGLSAGAVIPRKLLPHLTTKLFRWRLSGPPDRPTCSKKVFWKKTRRQKKGSPREKLQLVFDMCDRNREGRVQRQEFCEFVKSLNMAAGVKIGQEVQDHVVESVLHRAGVDPDQEYLTYRVFEAIFSQMDDIRRPVGVHLRGVNLRINLEETQSLNSFAVTADTEDAFKKNSMSLLLSNLESYRQHIVVLFLFFAGNALVFLERFWTNKSEGEDDEQHHFRHCAETDSDVETASANNASIPSQHGPS
ncbi:hypothetical protein niasHS_000410 [Heterodera schachtii]|uniref:EF-hand domain-containing protein n=1 Tax=Heterodera schachtii TaxID=97005 RepID=A0ABD2KCN4_HETSC